MDGQHHYPLHGVKFTLFHVYADLICRGRCPLKLPHVCVDVPCGGFAAQAAPPPHIYIFGDHALVCQGDPSFADF